MGLTQNLRNERTRWITIGTLASAFIAFLGAVIVAMIVPFVVQGIDAGTWPGTATALVIVGAAGTAACSILLHRQTRGSR